VCQKQSRAPPNASVVRSEHPFGDEARRIAANIARLPELHFPGRSIASRSTRSPRRHATRRWLRNGSRTFLRLTAIEHGLKTMSVRSRLHTTTALALGWNRWLPSTSRIRSKSDASVKLVYSSSLTEPYRGNGSPFHDEIRSRRARDWTPLGRGEPGPRGGRTLRRHKEANAHR
jgi:hypothetical protein